MRTCAPKITYVLPINPTIQSDPGKWDSIDWILVVVVVVLFFGFSDSVENQEGGAMYISCGDDAVAVEAEMGYVPNNPLFGLPLDSPQVNFCFHLINYIFDSYKTRLSTNFNRTIMILWPSLILNSQKTQRNNFC